MFVAILVPFLSFCSAIRMQAIQNDPQTEFQRYNFVTNGDELTSLGERFLKWARENNGLPNIIDSFPQRKNQKIDFSAFQNNVNHLIHNAIEAYKRPQTQFQIYRFVTNGGQLTSIGEGFLKWARENNRMPNIIDSFPQRIDGRVNFGVFQNPDNQVIYDAIEKYNAAISQIQSTISGEIDGLMQNHKLYEAVNSAVEIDLQNLDFKLPPLPQYMDYLQITKVVPEHTHRMRLEDYGHISNFISIYISILEGNAFNDIMKYLREKQYVNNVDKLTDTGRDFFQRHAIQNADEFVERDLSEMKSVFEVKKAVNRDYWASFKAVQVAQWLMSKLG